MPTITKALGTVIDTLIARGAGRYDTRAHDLAPLLEHPQLTVAGRRRLSQAMLSSLNNVERAVACLDLPVESLTALAASEDAWQRRHAGAAAILGQLPELAAELAADPDPDVRAFVAGNPRVGVMLLVALATDRRKEVRTAVASNPSAPTTTVLALTSDRAAGARSAAIDALLTRAYEGSKEAAAALGGLDTSTVLAARTGGEWQRPTVSNELRLEVALALLGTPLPRALDSYRGRVPACTVAELPAALASTLEASA
jgi:hypothetical protein